MVVVMILFLMVILTNHRYWTIDVTGLILETSNSDQVCQSGFQRQGNFCYQVTWKPRGKPEAEEECNRKNAVLANVNDLDTFRYWQNLKAEGNDSGNVWVGAVLSQNGNGMVDADGRVLPKHISPFLISNLTNCSVLPGNISIGYSLIAANCDDLFSSLCQQAVCPADYTTDGLICFKTFHKPQLNQSESEGECAKYDGSLVSTNKLLSSATLKRQLEEMISSGYWIGLELKLSSLVYQWTWIANNFVPSEETLQTLWGVRRPHNESCARISSDLDFKLEDYNCLEVLPFICEGDPLTYQGCSSGYTLLGSNGCYQVFLERKTFYDAQSYCVRMGGFLASVPDVKVLSLLKELIYLTTYGDGYWTGITKHGDSWWYDQSTYASCTLQWAPMEPQITEENLCTLLSWKYDFKMVTAKCGQNQRYICEMIPQVRMIWPLESPQNQLPQVERLNTEYA
ncbi:macrophage mannose receptor 1-like [Tachypleus tridentatus]|uniref:macrophage mannose receptor 1-like n=1 Tax=Tachypleus tridentatus TaxID=6853 RepID=UPI003FD52B8D